MWECPWCDEIIEMEETVHTIICPLCGNKCKFKDVFYDPGGGGSYILDYAELVKEEKDNMIVSLLGTCADSTWRDDLIPLLKISYFNPVVKEWDSIAKENEIKHRKYDDFLLYYFTPKMQGFYAVAELIEDSIKNPKRTIFSYTMNDGDKEFDKKQLNSLKEIGNMVQRNGATFIEGSLEDVAEYINKNSSRFIKHIKN